MVNLERDETFIFLGFDFRRVRSLRGVWRPQYTPTRHKRMELLPATPRGSEERGPLLSPVAEVTRDAAEKSSCCSLRTVGSRRFKSNRKGPADSPHLYPLSALGRCKDHVGDLARMRYHHCVACARH